MTTATALAMTGNLAGFTDHFSLPRTIFTLLGHIDKNSLHLFLHAILYRFIVLIIFIDIKMFFVPLYYILRNPVMRDIQDLQFGLVVLPVIQRSNVDRYLILT